MSLPARICRLLVALALIAAALIQTPALAQSSSGGLLANEVVRLLGGSTNNNRMGALRRLEDAGQLGGPYTVDDANSFIAGMEGYRNEALRLLGQRLPGNLNAQQVAALLASMQNNNRMGGLRSLHDDGRLANAYTVDEANSFIAGMEGYRNEALRLLGPRLPGNLNAQQVAALLASMQNNNRMGGLRSLHDDGRLANAYTVDAANSFIAGMEGYRNEALRLLGPRLPGNLNAQQVVALLASMQNNNRMGGVRSLYDDGRLASSYTAADVESFISGMESYREEALRLLATRIVSGGSSTPPVANTPPQPPQPTVPAPPASTASAANIQRRINSFMRMARDTPPYLYGGTSLGDMTNIVAMDLPTFFGTQDYRKMYDQNYFAALQYQVSAVTTLSLAKRYLDRSDLERASHTVDVAAGIVKRANDSFSAASAAANRDVNRATTYVKAIYESSKYTSRFVSRMVPGSSSMVDALWIVTDAGITAHDDGIGAGFKQLTIDALTTYIMDHVKLADLGNMTLSEYMDHGSGRILNNQGVIADIGKAIKNPTLRRAIVAEVKSLVSKAGGGAIVEAALEDSINAGIELILQGAQGN